MDLHRKQRSLPTPRPFFTLAAIWLALAAMLVFPHACVVSSPSVACLPCPCANGLTCANGLCVPPEQQTNPLSFCFADGQTSDGLLTEPLHQETTPKDAATPEEITPSEDAATPEEITLSEEATTPEESTLIEPSPEEATTEPNPEISPDTRCTDDTDCPTGSICLTEKGECAPSECTPTRPCNGFLACINGRCQACQVDDQCKPRGTGYFCLDGICIRKAVLTNNVYAWSDGTYASDCMQYRYPTLGFEPASQDGVYRIQPPGESPFLTHCMMRYAGGGWTLTLRIDGQKQNFSYSEPLWTNRNSTANIASPDALAKEEVKPPSYWSLPFQQILLHNASSPKSTPLILNATAASTLAFFQQPNNTELPTSPTSTPPQPPRSAWRAFFPKSSLQKYCNQIFVNFSATDLNASFVNLRLGFVTDGDSTCKTPNGFIGIGGRSRLLPSISAGNLCTNSSSCETNDTTKPALIGLYIRDLPPIKSTLKRVLGVLQPSTGPIPRSCLAYRMPPHNHTNNDNYWIQPANSPLPMITFCEMTRHGGGWTALLKTNNTAQFAYDSALWTNTATLNESPTVNPVFTDAYKLNTFHSFPIEELLVSLHNTNSSALYVNYFSFLFSASSMLNAIQIPRRFDNEDPRPWRDLLPDTNLHSGCTQIGTTLTPAANNNYAHLRLGLIAAPDQPLLCTIASSYIGLGAKLSACNVNNAPSTGHAIGCITTGAAPQITPATGYLFAR